MVFEVKNFDDLTKKELYEILRLRSEVFVVEQDCVYQDIDNKDYKALHVIGKKEGNIIAYTRLFDGGDYFDTPSIGRVVVKEEQRKYKYGHQLMEASIEAILQNYDNSTITISAQKYLIKFYENLGFKTIGETYLEDGIPHIRMIR